MASILKEHPAPISQWQPMAPRSLGQSGSGVQAPIIPERKPWLWPAVAAAAVLAIAGAAWAFWPAEQQAARVTRFVSPLPEGVEVNTGSFYVKVSPDGTKLAFTSVGQQAGIWVRDLEAVEARLLPGTAGAVSPYWSPDSRSLAYSVANKLFKVDVAGGPPQLLAESATVPGSGFWTEDGMIVFGGRGVGPMQKVSAAGGIPAPVTVLGPGEAFHSLPSLLPDGKHFIYLRAGAGGKTGFYVGALDVSPEQQPDKQFSPNQFGATFVRTGNSDGGNLFFLRDGTLMAQPFDTTKFELVGDPVPVAQQIGTGPSHGHFSVTPGGLLAYRTGTGFQSQLRWIDRQGKSLGDVGEASVPNLAVTLSPDESQVVLFVSETTNTGSGDIWLLDVARNIKTRFTFGQSVSLEPGSAKPVWSPDGKQIAFFSKGKFFAKPSSGAGEPQPLRDVAVGQPGDWSNDGRFLIYAEGAGATRNLMALPMNAGAPGEPVKLLEKAYLAELSPDGRWLAYTSVESGQNEVYIQPFVAPGTKAATAGAKWQVSRDGGTRPKWRADGKELFFLGLGGQIMAAGIEVAGDALRPAAPVQLFSTTLISNAAWDVTRDGQRFLINEPLDRGSNTPITVVMNWQAALKR